MRGFRFRSNLKKWPAREKTAGTKGIHLQNREDKSCNSVLKEKSSEADPGGGGGMDWVASHPPLGQLT